MLSSNTLCVCDVFAPVSRVKKKMLTANMHVCLAISLSYKNKNLDLERGTVIQSSNDDVEMFALRKEWCSQRFQRKDKIKNLCC